MNQFRGKFDDLDQQTVFQFTFLAEDGRLYDYGFSLDTRQVYEEWLMIMEQDGNFVPLFRKRQMTKRKQ